MKKYILCMLLCLTSMSTESLVDARSALSEIKPKLWQIKHDLRDILRLNDNRSITASSIRDWTSEIQGEMEVIEHLMDIHEAGQKLYPGKLHDIDVKIESWKIGIIINHQMRIQFIAETIEDCRLLEWTFLCLKSQQLYDYALEILEIYESIDFLAPYE